MSKVTIGVYKAYKNSGNLRFHKKGTKKSWKHYFVEVDDYDEDEYSFGSEWVSAFKAVILKKNKSTKKYSFVWIVDLCLQRMLRKTKLYVMNVLDVMIRIYLPFLLNPCLILQLDAEKF